LISEFFATLVRGLPLQVTEQPMQSERKGIAGRGLGNKKYQWEERAMRYTILSNLGIIISVLGVFGKSIWGVMGNSTWGNSTWGNSTWGNSTWGR
jgi:hypothetical protein